MTALTAKSVREVAEWIQTWRAEDRVDVETTPTPRITVQRAGGVSVYEADSIRRLVPGTGRSACC
ncbi:hypothetical protein [Streptosporangium sp. CA-115845]|uniref:hypothetical protein n=1 Tax=Streptosporangium sp. CA-115845 TaxID=3240071 RepID=UPI003D8BC3C0